MNKVLLQGDCLEVLKDIPDNSIDSLITDPPAGISFMGKDWDSHKGGRKQWIEWMSQVMSECLRVLKPGAHGLVWAIPRTSHWTATALEDAGFEIRDVVTHLFGSGFPKSHNIEKSTGDERFKGIGTALKPASEHWILVRKPCSEKTVAANVLKHGTGGINIDASRINVNPNDPNHRKSTGGYVKTESEATIANAPYNKTRDATLTNGRFPANLVLSHNEDCVEIDSTYASEFECTSGCAVAELDRQSGRLVGAGNKIGTPRKQGTYFTDAQTRVNMKYDNGGGASRFFYCAKASKKDKGADNTHPTVKSSSLMSYLIKMITPPNGLVLDPFMGSGSTGVAAIKNNFDFIGIEKEDEYYKIAEARLETA